MGAGASGNGSPAPPWTPDGARAVADAVLRSEGLHEPDIELLRFYQNAVFRLPRNGLTLRVYGPEDPETKARLMVSVARFLEARAFPSVRLAPRAGGQLFAVLGRQVSLWRWIDEDVGSEKDFRAFGVLLRRLHMVPGATEVPAPVFDPMAKIGGRLARLQGRLPAAHLDVLKAAAARVAAEAEKLANEDAPPVLLHGNTLLAGGELRLIDFDSVGFGARAWDLAPTLVAVARFGKPQSIWRAFLDGYGADGVSMARVEAASMVKQLSMTVALCFNRGLSPDIDAELDRRIDDWSRWDFDTRWHSPSLRPVPVPSQTVEQDRQA